jgi:hypothetical protein
MRSKDSLAPLWLGALGLLGGAVAVLAWVTYDVARRERDRIEAREAIKSIDNVFDRALQSIESPQQPAKVPQNLSYETANSQAARDSAKAGVRAAGLGDLIVGSVSVSGENVVISGTAVGKSDSTKVIVKLKERRSKSGRANYSVVSVQPES